MVMRKAERLARMLENSARSSDDIEAAKMLRHLAHGYSLSREVVLAKTHDHSKAAYAELIDYIRGKHE